MNALSLNPAINSTPLYPAPTFTDLTGAFQYVQTFFWLGQVICVVVFLVAFFALKRYDSLRALPAAFFVTTLVATVLFIMQIVPDYFVAATTMGTAVSVLALYFKGDL